MNYLKKITTAETLVSLLGSFGALEGEVKKTDNEAVFENDTVRVTSAYLDHPTGLIKRRDKVENISDTEIFLNTAFSRFMLDGGEYEVYTQYSEWCGESQGRWQDLVTEIGGRSYDVRSNASTPPFFAIFNKQTGRGIAFHILAGSTWSFNVRKIYRQKGQLKNLLIELGLDNSNLNYKLLPGETLELPEILYYEFRNKTDLEAYRLHRYCKEFYRPKAFPMIYDTWMSKFDLISFDLLSEQLAVAKELGLEYFVIDAGWFGPANSWFEIVGDWYECETDSMRGRMKEFADKVRSEGLKFGLWFEIERAALTSKTVADHPEHYLFDNGYAFVNFGDPASCDYIFDILASNVRKYGIEFIKFDFNAPLLFDKDHASFIKYFEGYKRFIKRIGDTFPELYLENCASGGMRMSLSSLEGFDSFWISDNHSLYTQLEIFKNTALRMPSRALETWVTIRSFEGFEPVYGGGTTEKILTSGNQDWSHVEVTPESFLYASAVGGPIGFSCDLTKLSEATKGKIKEFIANYKEERVFWQNSECHILCDTPTMLVLQFCDEALEELKIYVYSKAPSQNSLTVYPFADKASVYECSGGSTYTGVDLDREGIDIPVGGRYTATTLTLKRKK